MENYKEVKNIIHNDLKITKEEIREIIKQTIEIEVKKVLNDESFIETLIKTQIKDVLRNKHQSPNWKRVFDLDTEIYNAVCSEVSQIVKEKVKISLED